MAMKFKDVGTGGALAGTVVVDLTQMLAGPFCTQMLADQGATVIKIETMKGDGTRGMGPYLPEDELRAYGGYFQSVNRNKLSIALNLKTDEGRDLLRRLIDQADVVVENFRAGVMERLGLSYESLKARNPVLVYGTVRGFGDPRSGASPYGDWPSYDVVAQAMGGIMGITGPSADQPTKVGPGVGDTVPALMLTIGILAALNHAQRTGQGQFVDVAMVDCVLALSERLVYQKSYAGHDARPEGNRHPLLAPFGLFRAQDGWVSIACAHDEFWVKLSTAIGRPELGSDDAFATNAARVRNMDAVIDVLEGFTRPRTKLEIAAVLGGIVPFGPVYSANDIFEDPHFRNREMLVPVAHPGTDRTPLIAGVPIKLGATPGGVHRRAPTLGEQTDEILSGIGLGPTDIAALRVAGVVG